MAPKKFGVFEGSAAAPGVLLPNKLGMGLGIGLGGSPLKGLPADDATIGGVAGLAKKPGELDAVTGAPNMFPGEVAGLTRAPEGTELATLVLGASGTDLTATVDEGLVDRRGGVLVRLGSAFSPVVGWIGGLFIGMPNGVLDWAGFGIKEGSDLEAANLVEMASAVGERGALAKGELRVGRVLGLPIPRVNIGGAKAEGVATGVASTLGSASGEPGGVVLASPVSFVGVAALTTIDDAFEG